jgi:hypothetical protein
MQRIPVSSSNVDSVGYDEDSGTLEVEFKNGTVYQYFDVPSKIYENLMSASSIGGFLASSIKGSFRFSKV